MNKHEFSYADNVWLVYIRKSGMDRRVLWAIYTSREQAIDCVRDSMRNVGVTRTQLYKDEPGYYEITGYSDLLHTYIRYAVEAWAVRE